MLISVVFFLFISLAIISGLVSPTVREFKNSSDLIKSRQSLFLSESGAEDAYYRLKNALAVDSSETITLNNNTATTTITDSSYNEKTVIAEGDVSSRERKNKLVLLAGTGVSFSYGVQSGVGGFTMGNNSQVQGSVYSNGSITGSGSITSTALSAGPTGLIDGITVGTGSVGNAYAHTVNDSTIAGTNYCQTGTGNNKSCNQSQPDPEPVAMPITEEEISAWKTEAAEGGTYTGNYTVNDTSASLGPKKITGNLTIDNNADFTVTGTLWVQGNMVVSNNATVRLAPSYGTSEGVIVVDGTVSINNNAIFAGSGETGSYLMVLSTYTSGSAITLENNGGAVILYAASGTVNLANNARAKSLNGYRINLNNNAVVIYDTGLANANFVNGPSGGWGISSWKEVE